MLLNVLNLKKEGFGLDISDRSMKLVRLEKRRKRKLIVSFGRIEVPPNIIKAGEIKEIDKLASLIKKLIRESRGKKINTPYVVASLPEEKTFSQVIALPKMTEEEAKQAIRFEAEKYIPYSVNDVYLDCQKVIIENAPQDRTYVLFTALPKKTVDKCVQCLRIAGLKPVALEVESQSTIRAIFDQKIEKLPPTLVLDIGTTRTGFIIFSGTAIRFTTSIPVSSGSFTRSISKALKIDIEKAEKLKQMYGITRKGKKGEGVFEALVPPLTDLTEQIKKYIDYYHTRAQKDPSFIDGIQIEKIILTGGGAKMKGLNKFFQEQLNIPTEIANPLVNVEPPPYFPKDQALEYTNAIGLALRSLEENELY
ncbi:MAG: type IV pilus assembly protein PilM [Candidatus Omnitrophota bacterium]